MTQQERVARIIYAVIYGCGTDRTFDLTQPIYRNRAMEAAGKILEALDKVAIDTIGGFERGENEPLPLLAESELGGE